MHFRTCPTHRRAFTLMEALMATGILFAVVAGVCAAVTAGQQHAFEAQQRIAAALAADELMGRLSTLAYDALPDWHGHEETVGAMLDHHGAALSGPFAAVGRSVSVRTTTIALPDVAVTVRGREVRVRAFDRTGRTLTELTRFIAEPQA